MNKKTLFIILVIIVIFGGFIGVSAWQNRQSHTSYTLDDIKAMTQKIDFDQYAVDEVIVANKNSGNMQENIKGDPNAPVKIFEYADYQCEHCASLNPTLNKIVEDYNGKVAVVFRTYVMSYHKNGVLTAAAANAAAKQGYWADYKDILFNNQADWYNLGSSALKKKLKDYFTEASQGKGDVNRFKEDMQDAEVYQKIAFDMGISDKADLQWTPSVFVDGEFVSQKKSESASYSPAEFNQKIRDKIDEKLEKNK